MPKRKSQKRGPVMFRRPRDGYRDYADRLDPDTVRVGSTTFAVKRKPGERIGSMKERP